MRLKILFLSFLAVFFVAGSAIATPTVDGNFGLAEWAGYYADDNGFPPNGFVDPGWGGQAYDVEYLGLYFNSNTLYFGLQTGFDLESITSWGPGDFALNVDGDSFYEYAIHYSISGNDVEYSLVDMTSGASWDDVAYSSHSDANPFQADFDPLADLVVSPFIINNAFGTTTDTVNGGTSYVLEGSFDLAYLASHYTGDDITIHWTMGCGNDYLDQTSSPVPEPATMLLLGVGLIGVASIGRKRFLKKA